MADECFSFDSHSDFGSHSLSSASNPTQVLKNKKLLFRQDNEFADSLSG